MDFLGYDQDGKKQPLFSTSRQLLIWQARIMLLDWSINTVSRISHLLNFVAMVTLVTSLVTNQWILSEERILEPANNPEMQSNMPGYKLKNHNYTIRRTESGMWRFCQQEPQQDVDCIWIHHYVPDHTKMVDPRNATTCILYATMISMPSLVSAAGVALIGLITNLLIPFRKIWIFITGIIYVMAGICTFTCLLLFITYVVQELDHKEDERGSDGDPIFDFQYGYSMILAMVAFCCQELGGIGLVYLSVAKFREHWTKKDRIAERNQRQMLSFEQQSYYDPYQVIPLQRSSNPHYASMELALDNGKRFSSPRLQRKCMTEPDLDLRTRDVYIGNHFNCSYNIPNHYPTNAFERQSSTRSADSNCYRSQNHRTVTFSEEARHNAVFTYTPSNYAPSHTYAQVTKEFASKRNTDWRMTPV